MKHARQDYNRIQDPSGQIPDDEPVFLLRGQDICAPVAIQAWADKAEKMGVAAQLVQAARDWALEMLNYRIKKGRGKVPDAPMIAEKDQNADIKNIDDTTADGQLLMAAIATITGKYETNKTPFEVMAHLQNIRKKMYGAKILAATGEGEQCVKCGNWYRKGDVCEQCFIDENGPDQTYPS